MQKKVSFTFGRDLRLKTREQNSASSSLGKFQGYSSK